MRAPGKPSMNFLKPCPHGQATPKSCTPQLKWSRQHFRPQHSAECFRESRTNPQRTTTDCFRRVNLAANPACTNGESPEEPGQDGAALSLVGNEIGEARFVL